MIVVLENREYSSIIGSSQAPYLNSLASRYALLTNHYAKRHPSLPNYLELLGGQTFGITDDCTSCSVEGTVLTDQLQAKGLDWRSYMEGASGPCPNWDTGGYAKRHNPFVYVRHLLADSTQCNKVVPFGSFASDLASPSAAPFIWVTPTLCNDGHDCSTQVMDTWIHNNIEPVLLSNWYRNNGTVILTFDEGTSGACASSDCGGHIATVVISEAHKGAQLTHTVTHGGLLRSIETTFGLSCLADSCGAGGTDLSGILP